MYLMLCVYIYFHQAEDNLFVTLCVLNLSLILEQAYWVLKKFFLFPSIYLFQFKLTGFVFGLLQEASGELVVTPSETLVPAETTCSPDTNWTLADLCSQFVELYAWLDSVQSFALGVQRTTCTDDYNASATKSDRTVDREERDDKIRAVN